MIAYVDEYGVFRLGGTGFKPEDVQIATEEGRRRESATDRYL